MYQKVPDDALNKRAKILEVATEFFGKHGFSGTSISDIATGVGVTKPTLYYHFQDKDAIFAAIILDVLDAIYQHTRAAAVQSPAGRERLKALMLAHADFMELNPSGFNAAHYGFYNLKDIAQRKLAVELRDRYEAMVRVVLLEGVEVGHFVSGDIAAMGRLILASLNWMARWYKVDGVLRPREFALQSYELLMSGLARREPEAGLND